MAISQTVADIWLFNDSQNGGYSPSWICCTHFWTTYGEYLAVFITVQNLVGINALD